MGPESPLMRTTGFLGTYQVHTPYLNIVSLSLLKSKGYMSLGSYFMAAEREVQGGSLTFPKSSN